jgi:hypothetical protein
MVGEYVVTQPDTEGGEDGESTVAFASYMIDSHNCRRLSVRGRVLNEGDIQKRLERPFGIPYEALLPKASECTNLLVPVCLAASHIAYSSIRMEPVYMMLGQASGIAAAMAIENGTPLHRLETRLLRLRLMATGQAPLPKKVER